MKYTGSDIYHALIIAETGDLANKFIRNNPKFYIDSGYGSIQINAEKGGIIDFFFINKYGIFTAE